MGGKKGEGGDRCTGEKLGAYIGGTSEGGTVLKKLLVLPNLVSTKKKKKKKKKKGGRGEKGKAGGDFHGPENLEKIARKKNVNS